MLKDESSYAAARRVSSLKSASVSFVGLQDMTWDDASKIMIRLNIALR